jgi:hypothetical protein
MNVSKKTLRVLSLLALTTSLNIMPKVHVVLTAAITNNYYETRKQQYVAMIQNLGRYGYTDVYIIEAIKKQGRSYFDDYSKNVFYATCNKSTLKNIGINEGLTMQEGLKHFNFAPEDMVLKLTGRYECTSDAFIKFVEAHQDADAVVKFTPDGQVLTLCYAMKYKHFMHMFETLDYDTMEKDMIYIETAVGKYIRDRMSDSNFKVISVDKVYVKADIRQSQTFSTQTWNRGNSSEVEV